MPNLDRTGPRGSGSKTGLRLGDCINCQSSPRPRTARNTTSLPPTTFFKPAGVPLSSLREVVVRVDEFESLRLHDVEGLDQTQASSKMGISQPTFARLINSAYHKVAHALVSGQAIRIDR